MTILGLLNLPVLVVEPAIVASRYGDSAESFELADGAVMLATVGWFHQTSSTQADGTLTDGVLFLPGDVDVSEKARVQVVDRAWTVFGIPRRARRPDGSVHHLEVTLKAVTT